MLMAMDSRPECRSFIICVSPYRPRPFCYGSLPSDSIPLVATYRKPLSKEYTNFDA